MLPEAEPEGLPQTGFPWVRGLLSEYADAVHLPRLLAFQGERRGEDGEGEHDDERDATMIVVSHEMGFARNAADRVLFMDEGAIVEEGPPARIFESPTHERTRAFIGQIQRH